MRPFRFLADARAVVGGRQLADRARRAEIDELAPVVERLAGT